MTVLKKGIVSTHRLSKKTKAFHLALPTPGPPQRPASTRGKLGQALPHKGGGENSGFGSMAP